MRILFTMDAKDYDLGWDAIVRHSARGIILRHGRVAMVHSRKYDYYKFPGGGIEAGEDPVSALVREVREESGLRVLPETIREYGIVPRRQRSTRPGVNAVFIQDNLYYLCEAEEDCGLQELDDYEAEEGFTLAWVTPQRAIHCDRFHDHGPTDQPMLEREARVLELLVEEGLLPLSPEA